jgi:repressor LexA
MTQPANLLTRKQQQVWDYFQLYMDQHSTTPSYAHIQKHFRFASPNAVTKYVRVFEKKGLLKPRTAARPYEHRGIIPNAPGVPILGTIAAGAPIEAIENVEAVADLTPFGIHNTAGDHFMLKVRGQSMVEAHVLDGDLAIIRQQPRVKSNEIAAVLWNNEATLKYVRKTGSRVLLVPANSAMEPIEVTAENTLSFSILGKMVGLVRKQ